VPVYYHRFEMPSSYYENQAIRDPEAWELNLELHRNVEAGEITCENLSYVYEKEIQRFQEALNNEYRGGRISLDLFETTMKLANDISIMIFFKKDYDMAHYLLRTLLTIVYQADDHPLIKAVDKYYIYYLLATEMWPRCPTREEYAYERAKRGEYERLVDKYRKIIQLE